MSETPAPAPPAPAPAAAKLPERKWRRRLRRLAIGLVVLVLVVRIGAVALAPSILDRVARGFGLTCSVGRLELSVLAGELEVAHVTVAPLAGGEPILDLGYLRADVSPLALLRGQVVVRRLEVDGLDVLVDREADGRFALERIAAAAVGSTAAVAAESPRAAPEPAKTASDSAPPSILVEALHAAHVHVHLRDASVKPALDARLELNAGVVDLAFLSSSSRPARLSIDVTCPPLLDALRVEGTTKTDGSGALTVALDRLHLAPLAPYLEPLRVRPQARDLSFGLALTGRVHGTAAVLSLEHVALTADGREALALDALGIDVRKLAADRIEVAKVIVRGIRADAVGLPDGALRVAGVDLLPPKPLPEEAPAPAEEPAPPAAAPGNPPPQVALDELRIEDVRGTFTGENPPAELSLRVDSVSLTGIDPAKPDVPARLRAKLAAPNAVESVTIEGTALPFASTAAFDLAVAGDRLTLRAIAPYLRRAGIEPLLADGRFSLQLSGRAPRGRPMEGDLALENVLLADGERELAGIDGVRLRDARLDLEAASLSVGSIEVARPRLAPVARDRSGTLVACGLRVTPSSEGPRDEPEPAPRPARPEKSGIQGKPPHLRIGRVLVEKLRARFDDDSVTPPAALVLADARFLLGAVDLDLSADAKEPPPTSLEASLDAPGNVESVELRGTLVASPRAPSLALTLEAKGVTARAAAAYLEKAGVEPELGDGHLTLSLGASAAIDRAGPVKASASIEELRWSDGPKELLALSGLRVKDVTLDPAKLERVEVGAVELERLATAATSEPRGVLRALGFALSAPPPAPEEAGLPPPRRASEGPAPLVRVGKVRVGAVALDLREESEEPAFELPLRAAAEVGPLVFDASGRTPLADAPYTVALAAKGAFERLVVAGNLAASPRAARIDGRLETSGITARALRERLARKGLEPLLRDGSFGLRFEARADMEPARRDAGEGETRAELHVADVVLADGEELAGIDAIDVSGVRATSRGLEVESVVVERPRARAAKDAQGALLAGGFRIAPAPAGGAPAPAEPDVTARGGSAPPRAAASAAPFEVSLRALAVRGASVAWSDSSVQPAAALSLSAGLHVERLLLGSEQAAPATVDVRFTAPGVLARGSLAGEVAVKPGELALRLAFDLDGVRAGTLAPYLGAGARSELESGAFHADLAATVVPRESGPSIDLAVTRVDWRDGRRSLLHVDDVIVQASELSPTHVALEKLAAEGIETHVEKTPAGETRLLGLLLSPAPAAVATATETASRVEPAPAVERPRRGRRARPPLVGLDALRLSVRELSFHDRSKPGADPLVVSNLVLENTKPVRLLGPDPAAQPAIELRLSTEVAPVASSIVVTARLAPFALEPDFAVSLAIDGLRGAGLTRVAPELAAKIDGSGLVDGHASASTVLALKTGRRDPLDFSALASEFGLDVTVSKVSVHDGPRGPVLVGLDELHADVARIDSLSNVHVRALEIARPAGLVRNETGGLRVLGLLVKPSPENDVTVPAPDPKATAAAETAEPAPALAPRKPGPEVRIDRISVTDVAFTYEDTTAETPLVAPLTGLDVNVTSFTTKAFEERRSIRFDAVVKGGKIRLPKRVPKDAIPGASSVLSLLGDVKDAVTTGEVKPKPAELEERPFFDEIAVKGELALAPGPFGTIEASVSGLELQDLKGPASKSGVKLEDGVLDLDSSVRFGAAGDVAARATITLTDLDLEEKEDGPIRRFFHFPAPTSVVVFVLRDEDGSIEIPLDVKIPPLTNDMSPAEKLRKLGPRLAAAALATFGEIVARAIAHSPFRVLSSGGDLTKGALQLIPGSDVLPFLEKPKAAAEPVLLHFAAGDASVASAELAKLADVAKKLGADEELTVTLRHAVGGGDLGREKIAANPAPRDRRDLLARLASRRADLERERGAALAEERAALRDGLSADAAAARARAARLEDELAATERALDSVLDLERDGAERQVDRRTRAACVELARARLEAVRSFLATALGKGEERIRVSRPRVEEVPGDDGGTVTVTISQRKKR